MKHKGFYIDFIYLKILYEITTEQEINDHQTNTEQQK